MLDFDEKKNICNLSSSKNKTKKFDTHKDSSS